MKLDVAVKEVTLSNVGVTGEFRIRNSAKAFSILSSGLYSNKIRAIVRELSCNAVDSHVAAGKKDVPFEVHLPSMFEPWFSVKDFGTGLSGDQIVGIYTTYFESSKTDSNDFIGALGLGSKSPFSYTDNFTVTAVKNNIKVIYSAYINDAGIPCVAEMGAETADEPNGVEVKFAVTNRNDYYSFQREAAYVFTWFKNKPTITGINDFVHSSPEYSEENIIPGVHVKKQEGYYSQCAVLMGNICYPLSAMPQPEKTLGDLAHLLDCNLVMEFDIGELDFAASREELSYVPLTINSIKAKLEQLNENLAAHLETQASAIMGDWQRAFFLHERAQTKLYKSAVKKYVTDTNFKLFDTASAYGKTGFKFTEADLISRKLDIKAFRVRTNTTSNVDGSISYVGNVQHYTVEIPVEKDVVIVLNDLKTGCVSRARRHMIANHKNGALVFCISHANVDPAVRSAEYDKLIKELAHPPIVMKASELDNVTRAKSGPVSGIMQLEYDSSRKRSGQPNYRWVAHTEEIDKDQIYYYIPLFSKTLEKYYDTDNSTKTLIEINEVKEAMKKCEIPSISNIKIFGVRKSTLNQIIKLENWIPLKDKLKEETAKITDQDIMSYVASTELDSYHNRAYTSDIVSSLVGVKSKYYKFVNEVAKIKKSTGDVNAIVKLCSMYGNTVSIEVTKSKLTNALTFIKKQYPLLQHLYSNTPEADMAEYIKLIDNQEKI